MNNIHFFSFLDTESLTYARHQNRNEPVTTSGKNESYNGHLATDSMSIQRNGNENVMRINSMSIQSGDSQSQDSSNLLNIKTHDAGNPMTINLSSALRSDQRNPNTFNSPSTKINHNYTSTADVMRNRFEKLDVTKSSNDTSIYKDLNSMLNNSNEFGSKVYVRRNNVMADGNTRVFMGAITTITDNIHINKNDKTPSQTFNESRVYDERISRETLHKQQMDSMNAQIVNLTYHITGLDQQNQILVEYFNRMLYYLNDMNRLIGMIRN